MSNRPNTGKSAEGGPISMKLVAAVATIIGAIGLAVGLSITGGTDENGHPAVNLKITIGRKANPAAPVVTVDRNTQLGRVEQRQDADPTPVDEGPGVHEDMRDETPPNAPPDAAREVATTHTAGIGKPLPIGGAQNYSCKVHLLPSSSYSNRATGTRVKAFDLHYTVSKPGSLDAIYHLFSVASFGASSHLGLEPTGRCEQWVPWSKKAWTQGAFNSESESVEMMAMGTEPRSWWLAQPILKRGILAAIVSDRLRANGLPPDHVDPVGCGIQHSGWTDHNALECGMTHHDVQPAFPYDVFERQVKRAYYGGNPVPIRCTPRNIEKVLARRFPEMGIRVDGKIGNRSVAAVRRVQRGNYLKADGIVGPRTGRILGLEGCAS
jgi:peptidoglycan hydrolase-like protein with peptidoglycan-binding domain